MRQGLRSGSAPRRPSAAGRIARAQKINRLTELFPVFALLKSGIKEKTF
jgi:hypothetical protein